MTAGTVVITGGILATVILLCIIAVLCYCRLQVRAGAVPHLAMNPSSVTAPRAELLLQEGSRRGFLPVTPFSPGAALMSFPPPGAGIPPPTAFEALQHSLM